MQEKLAAGMQSVKETGQHLKEKAADLGHDLGEAGHHLRPGHAPSRSERVKVKAKEGAPRMAGILGALLTTALVRRALQQKKK